MSKRRGVTGVIVFAIVGAVMFELVGAWVLGRGAPWWAAIAAGVAVFPVVPVGWHLLGERKRRRARAAAEASAAKAGVKAKTSALTGGDRFALRMVTVAVVALAPLLFFRGRQVWRSVRVHPAWFVPHGAAGARAVHGDARLIGQVPADAELVVWARRVDGLAGGADGGARGAADGEEAKELLIAARGGGELLVVVRGSDKALADVDVAKLNEELGKQAGLPVRGPFVARRRASDLLVVVSEGWAGAADDRAAGRLGGPEAIMARLDAAPRDAVVVSAAAPARPVAGLTLTAMQSWLRVSDAGVRIDADFVVPDRAAATALVERLERERDELVAAAPAECRPKVDALLRDVVVVSGDTRVKAAAFWKPQPLGEAMMCGVGALMKRAEWK